MTFSNAVVFAAVALLASFAPSPTTFRIEPHDDLQAAIDRARSGDTILLSPGATYVGHFRLPVADGTTFITIRTAESRDLPRAGDRVVPADAPALAKLQSPDNQPVLRTAAGAHHWRVQLLEFLPSPSGAGDIIALGSGGVDQSDLTTVPHDIEIDRCYVHGDPIRGQKRGIALNSASTTVLGSYVSDIKAVGQDAQAVAGWNGPGPYLIENNYLEAAGENFLLGGSDPAISGLTASGVTFRRNHLAKPPAWRQSHWQVKNIFELKNARDVVVEDNLMEYAWNDAQSGYAVLLTPRNQDGQAPWAQVENVTFRGNVVRHAGGGIQVTGVDANHPSSSTRGVRIVENLFYDISAARWGGTGAFLLIGSGPSEIIVERNTIGQDGNIVTAYGGSKAEPEAIREFVFRGNVVRHNEYGVHGADRATGLDTLAAFFPGAIFSANVIAGGDPSRYPKGNTFVPPRTFDKAFVNDTATRAAGVRPGEIATALQTVSVRQYH